MVRGVSVLFGEKRGVQEEVEIGEALQLMFSKSNEHHWYQSVLTVICVHFIWWEVHWPEPEDVTRLVISS